MDGFASALRLALLAALIPPGLATEPAAPAPKPTREMSAHVAEAFASTMPKYEPGKYRANANTAPDPTDQPRNGIIRLPNYIVRTTRFPGEYDMLTQKGREAAMAARYLGPQQPVDQALNGVTLTQLWQKIPLLGRIPFVPFNSLDYGQRAAAMYDNAEKRRRFAELFEIEHFAQQADKQQAPKDSAEKVPPSTEKPATPAPATKSP